VFVFAGSAQFIAVGLVESNTPPLIIVLTIFVVNLRHLLYSASMSAHLSHLPRRWKVALSWLLTDEAYVVASLRYQRPERRQAHWYMLGTGLALWASWQLSTWVGITLGSGIPAAWPLDFALPLTFMALLIPTLSDRPARIAAATAGLLALFLHALPLRLGLLLAAMFGIAAGVIADRLTIFLETTSG
jgi:4-azaleucine resistance transporter AzlC